MKIFGVLATGMITVGQQVANKIIEEKSKKQKTIMAYTKGNEGEYEKRIIHYWCIITSWMYFIDRYVSL
ncbi:MAG: hypothetical protein EOM50_01710 [Erysipelotrichia bacterium]|nr:hypothetical protein [Erysipelotrichia bacterium]